MELTLHIGAHGTATLTLRRYLSLYAPKLEKAGVACWTPPQTRDGRLAGVMGDPGRASPARDKLARRSGNRVRIAQYELAQTGCDHLLVSDDSLLGGLRENLSLGAVYPTAARRLARLVDVLPQVHTVGLAIRGYDTYWPAVIAACVSRGVPMPDAEHLAHIARMTRTWRDVVIDVVRCLPEAEVLVWSHEAMGGQPQEVAHALTGVRLDPPSQPVRLSTGPCAAKVQRILRDSGAETDVIGAEAGRFAPFSREQMLAMRMTYDNDINWLRQGADGLANFIDNKASRSVTRTASHPDHSTAARGLDREGNPHDGPEHAGPHTALDRACDKGIARQTP